MAGILTKSELAESYGISTRHLSKLLNNDFFEDLKTVGYQKQSKYLSPNVINKFYELYGKPLNNEE